VEKRRTNATNKKRTKALAGDKKTFGAGTKIAARGILDKSCGGARCQSLNRKKIITRNPSTSPRRQGLGKKREELGGVPGEQISRNAEKTSPCKTDLVKKEKPFSLVSRCRKKVVMKLTDSRLVIKKGPSTL